VFRLRVRSWFRAYRLELSVSGIRFQVSGMGLGFLQKCLRLRVQSLWFRIQDQGLG
jgi:hypothetical protein